MATSETTHELSTPISPILAKGHELLAATLDGQDLQKMELMECRVVVDEIDFLIAAMAAARTEVTNHVSDIKANQGIPARDLGREKEILRQARAHETILGIRAGSLSGLFEGLIQQAREHHNSVIAQRQSTV